MAVRTGGTGPGKTPGPFFILLAVLPLLYPGPFLAAQELRFTDFSPRGPQNYPCKTSPITIETLAFRNELQWAYNVSYSSMGRRVLRAGGPRGTLKP
ncbi:MAG: hypothetical protein LBG84_11100 [Treponema sp.]|jgi:hypothetical protein|nr:hypothetical protein [Treponema sp.]